MRLGGDWSLVGTRGVLDCLADCGMRPKRPLGTRYRWLAKAWYSPLSQTCRLSLLRSIRFFCPILPSIRIRSLYICFLVYLGHAHNHRVYCVRYSHCFMSTYPYTIQIKMTTEKYPNAQSIIESLGVNPICFQTRVLLNRFVEFWWSAEVDLPLIHISGTIGPETL